MIYFFPSEFLLCCPAKEHQKYLAARSGYTMSKHTLIPDEGGVSLRVHDTPESSSGGAAFMTPNQKVMMQATGASTIEQGPLTTRGLSVILPAYNEEAVIAMTVAQCVEALSVIAPDYEIIIVDDGSRDRTGQIADELAAANPRVRVIQNRRNRGYGGALIAGFQAVTKQLTFFMDSDGQFDIADIAQLLVYREQGYRAVLGYRERRRDAFLRLLNAKGWNVLVSLLLGLHIRDIDCAFKLYDTALVRVFDVTSEGAMINTEMLTKLTKLGIPYIQTPVRHYPRLRGKATGANVRVIANAFRELFRLRRKLRRWTAEIPPEEPAP
jgi:glycosyltransferase involved in cell wall biosynthesis